MRPLGRHDVRRPPSHIESDLQRAARAGLFRRVGKHRDRGCCTTGGGENVKGYDPQFRVENIGIARIATHLVLEWACDRAKSRARRWDRRCDEEINVKERLPSARAEVPRKHCVKGEFFSIQPFSRPHSTANSILGAKAPARKVEVG
jgi:hypothetical protein